MASRSSCEPVGTFPAWIVRPYRKVAVAVMNNTAASISNPYFESPVLSTNTPTAYGEANPPRLPSELISAMPDAAPPGQSSGRKLPER